MDILEALKALQNLFQGNITPEGVSLMLNILLGVVLFIIGLVRKNDGLVTLIKEKMIIAEKVLVKTMYNDKGEYNKAKEDLVVSLAKNVIKGINEDKLRLIVRGICQKVHEDVAVNRPQ